MKLLQLIAFTYRSFVQSRRLQQQDSSELANYAWHLDEDERYADEVGELIYADLVNIKIDSKRRKLIFSAKEKLGLAETLQRLHSKHPDIDRDVLESELLYWVEQNSAPENDGSGFTQKQMDDENERVEAWFDEYHQQTSANSKIAEKS